MYSIEIFTKKMPKSSFTNGLPMQMFQEPSMCIQYNVLDKFSEYVIIIGIIKMELRCKKYI